MKIVFLYGAMTVYFSLELFGVFGSFLTQGLLVFLETRKLLGLLLVLRFFLFQRRQVFLDLGTDFFLFR